MNGTYVRWDSGRLGVPIPSAGCILAAAALAAWTPLIRAASFYMPPFARPLKTRALWICHPDGKRKGEVTFEKTYKVEDVFTEARLAVTAHHKYVLLVNGKEVGRDDDWLDMETYDLTPFLKIGDNVLTVRVQHHYSPGAVFLIGRFRTKDGRESLVFSDGAWECVRTGDGRRVKVRIHGHLATPPFGWAIGGGPSAAELARIEKSFRKSFGEIVRRQVDLGGLDIIPRPRKLRALPGTFPVIRSDKSAAAIVVAGGDHGQVAARLLSQAAACLCPRELPIVADAPASVRAGSGRIFIGSADADPTIRRACLDAGVTTDSLGKHGYAVLVSPEQAILAANSDQGLAYAVYTFLQTWRKQGDGIVALCVRVQDAPPEGALYRGVNRRVDPAFAAFYKLNYRNYSTGTLWPLSKTLGELRKFLELRGITLALSFHPGGRDNRGMKAHFCFCDDAQMNDLLSRVREAVGLGFKVIEIYQDDFPNSLLGCPKCEAKYGKGLEGLTRAQVEMMNKVWAAVGGKAEVVFCPRAYFCVEDPERFPPGSPERKRVEKWWKSREVLRKSSLPSQLIMVTTHPDLDYLRELHRVYHGKRLLIFHNTLLPFDGRYWFEPYPPVSEEHLRYTWCWGLWCLGDLELWRAHLLTFSEAIWNPGRFLPLESAFAHLYGTAAAPALVEYAVLTYGSRTPRGVIADCRFQRPEYPQLFLDTGWFGRSRGKNFTTYPPTEETIERFTALARDAARAADLARRLKQTLPPRTAEKLELNAERLRLDFEIQTAILRFKSGGAGREVLTRALEQAGQLRRVIAQMQKVGARGEGNAGDAEFERVVADLLKK